MNRNRSISLLLALCLCFSLLVIPASAEETGFAGAETETLAHPLDSLCYSGGGSVIRVQTVDGVPYLFLPASADSENLVLSCELAEDERLYVAGDKHPTEIPADSGFALDEMATPMEGQYTLDISVRKLSADGDSTATAQAKLQVMQSANFSAVYLTSGEGYDGKDYVDKAKENAIKGSMTMLSATGEPVYDGELTQIKARGNSTFRYYPKKSYQIKLDKKTALIDGTKAGKTWVLLAGYADAVKLSDQLWKDVGCAVGVSYTPRGERVDLYFDGEYCGSYELSEKNQLNKNRVNITDMESAYEDCNASYGEDMKTSFSVNSYGNLFYYTKNLVDPEETGGFLLELNDKTGDEANWFKTSAGFAVNLRSPEYASRDVMLYISEYFQAFEDAIMATDSEGNYTGLNPDTGLYYYDYCDLDSLVQQYMLNCLSSNRDSFWHSLYFYMDTDGLLYAGPLWDMELTLGVGWNNSIPADQDWLAENDASGDWSEALIQIPSFRAALKEAYEQTYSEVAAALLGDAAAQESTGLLSISQRAELGRKSVAMDSVLWPEKLMDGSPCALYPNQSYIEYYLFGQKAKYRTWPDGTGYDEIVQARIDWLTAHKLFLDDYFAAMDGEHIHEYTDVVTEPTCTEQGYTTHTCECGEAYVDAYVDALGHDYTNGVCTVCGEKDPDYKEPTPAVSFTDVPDSAYYAKPVAWAVEQGITGGYPDGTFRPMSICTRAQIVTFLWRANGSPEPAGTAEGFNDLLDGAYYCKAVLWAAENGITDGFNDGGFHPDELVTRAQAMTFLWRANGCPEVPEGTVNTFSDVPETAYYHDAVLWAVANGITSGYNDTQFGPMDGCTRAQIVTFLYRSMAVNPMR